MTKPTLRPATPEDIPTIVALLEAAHLPAMELEQHVDHFVVAEQDSRVVACGGLEAYPDGSGLVRSMAVDESLRGRGVGKQIMAWVLDRAASMGITQLMLFTGRARLLPAVWVRRRHTRSLPGGCPRVGAVPRD